MTAPGRVGYVQRMRFRLGGFKPSVTMRLDVQDNAGQWHPAIALDGGTVEVKSDRPPIRGVVEPVVYVADPQDWEFETGEGDGWRILDIPESPE